LGKRPVKKKEKKREASQRWSQKGNVESATEGQTAASIRKVSKGKGKAVLKIQTVQRHCAQPKTMVGRGELEKSERGVGRRGGVHTAIQCPSKNSDDKLQGRS